MQRGQAYRILLSEMIEIFLLPLSTLKVRWWQKFNPLFWRRHGWHLIQRGRVAGLLRELARASAQDFSEFDERGFWHHFAELERLHPKAGLAFFRRQFEELT